MSAENGERKVGLLGRLTSVFARGHDAHEDGEVPMNEQELAVVNAMRAEEEARMRVEEEAKHDASSPYPPPQCHLPLGVTSGTRRNILSTAELREKVPQPMDIEFVQVVDPRAVEDLIRERGLSCGVDLGEETIAADRMMEATLAKTIPRLHRELEFAYARKKEYASKHVLWEWAEELRGRAKHAAKMDRSLKKPRKLVDDQQAAVDRAIAEKRKAEAEMARLQERLRKAAEDEQRARAGMGR